MLNLGLRTKMVPAALPVTATVPAAKPSNFAANFKSITCKPSCKPSTNNSPCPVSPDCRRSTSSLVPDWPSGPTARTGTMFRKLPFTRANRSGSSPGTSKLPATRSGPSGNTNSAVSECTLSPLPLGAAFSV